jgi:hypothetical protein
MKPSAPVSPALLAALLLSLTAFPVAAAQFTEIDPGLPQKLTPCVVVGDYDGDGDLDVLVTASGSHDIAFSTLYKNTGGTFTDSGIALLGLARASAAWGDFDGDGDLDLAISGVTSAQVPTTRVFRNDGATFSVASGSFLGVLAGNVAWGDYDGDGDLDLLVTGVTSASAQGVAATRLYRNDGGVFTSVPHPFPDCYRGAVAWGDYDNDGDLDVVITGTNASALFASVWRNDGNGNFTDAGAGLTAVDIGYVAWGDYDNDGDLDLLIGGDTLTSDGGYSRIYRNDGGTFSDVNAGLQGLLWSSAAWGDYDNDGDLDIMLMGYDAVAQATVSRLYRNDAGTFVGTADAFHNLFLGTLYWMDYDNDGDLDLLLAGNTSGLDVLRIYRNNNLTANAVPAAPANLAASVSGASANLTWDAASDDHTPAAGLSYNLRVGTTPGGAEIVSPQSGGNGTRRLPALGNTGAFLGARLNHLVSGATYYWSVQAVDGGLAGSAFAAEGSFLFDVTAVGDAGGNVTLALEATPNPAHGATTLRYALPEAGTAELRIYDAAGRRLRTLAAGGESAGRHTLRWDGLDASGRAAPGGLYFARLETRHGMTSRRFVLVR